MSKYLMRLTLFSLSISVLPTIFLGISAYAISSSSILDKVTKSNEQLLSQTEITIEQNIRIVDRTINQFTNLPIINSLNNMPLNVSGFQTIHDTNQYLEYMFTNGIGSDSIYYINLKERWAIYPDKIFHLDERQLEQYNALKNKLTQNPSLMLENNSQTGLPVTDLPKGILFIRTIPLYFNHSDGLIIVKISYDKIKNWIANSQNLGTLFILNDQMQIVASNSDQISDRQFPFPPGITDLKQKSGYFKAEFQGNKVYMFMKKSDYTNWTYLSVVPTGLVQKDSHWIGLITFLIGLFVTIILIILSFTGSRKLYSPIDKIYRSLQEGKNTFRGFNELEFVERVMRNMKHQIMAQGRDLKKYYVFQLLHSGITQHEIQEKILGNHPDLHHRNKYIVIVTQINTLNKSRFHESDRELLLFAMMNILEETIPDAIRLSPVVINQSMACVMGLENRSDEEDKKTVLVYVQTAMNKIKQYVGIPVSAGISRPVGDLSQAPYALEEAMNALNYRVKFGNESLMFIEDVEPSSHQFNPVRFPEQLSRQLLDAIKLNDQATIDRSLKEIIQCVLQNQDIHFTDYYTILMRLLSHIIHLHQPDNENATLILNGKSLPRELMDLKTSSEIEKWFKERVIAPVIQFIQEKNDRHSFHITEQIIHLIESEQEPTLDSISLKLNYSPVYLGQIFRKEKGISFSEYIKSHSINRAMELLQNTNQSIQEISVQLNYRNPQNFIRSFKKEIGITPGNYRRMHQNSN